MFAYYKKARSIAAIAATFFLWLSFQPLASAEMIGTGDIIAEHQSIIERDALLSSLERDEVKQALIEKGVDPQQAKQRVASMTDDEVAQLNSQIATLPAGAGVSTTNLLLIIILLVLLL